MYLKWFIFIQSSNWRVNESDKSKHSEEILREDIKIWFILSIRVLNKKHLKKNSDVHQKYNIFLNFTLIMVKINVLNNESKNFFQ